MNTETINDIQNDVDWLSGLPSRFPTHGSVIRLRMLLAKLAAASVYDPGESDLDDEQSIKLTVDLGDVRMARRLLGSKRPEKRTETTSGQPTASIQWKRDNIADVRSFIAPAAPLYTFGIPNIEILTPEGIMTAAPGDWITRLRDGSFRVDSQPREHGVRSAFYSNLPAWLVCLCGEEVSGQTCAWEDAGRELDRHVEHIIETGKVLE